MQKYKMTQKTASVKGGCSICVKKTKSGKKGKIKPMWETEFYVRKAAEWVIKITKIQKMPEISKQQFIKHQTEMTA